MSKTSNLLAFITGKSYGPPVVMGDAKTIMKKKAHGSTDDPVQQNLRWKVDRKKADKICCYNRKFAEHSGYFLKTSWLKEMQEKGDQPTEYFDSVTGKLLFTAPKDRSFNDFLVESKKHGWPSFRDNEVNWDVVRILPGGECVSIDGTHLGHNLADKKGNRYCINLVSVAGNPASISDDAIKQDVAETFKLMKDGSGCTGMFFRSNPMQEGKRVTTKSHRDWPRDNAVLKGKAFEAKDGSKWLHVHGVKQDGMAKFFADVSEEDVWMPFRYEQYFLESVKSDV